jgi:hypothetical protein
MSATPPLFILASPRSFTSLTSAMLGQHPETYGVPEINLFYADTIEDILQRLKDEGQARKTHGLLRTIAQLYAGEQSFPAIKMAHRWIMQRSHKTGGEVYLELCEKVQPLCIVDKSPAYSLFIENLQRIPKTFPDSYYLHLVRHPRGQGESVMKLVPEVRIGKATKKAIFGAPKTPNPTMLNTLDPSQKTAVIDYQFLWYRMQSRIMEFLESIPSEKQMRLRGEDLLGNPPLYFEKICRWLGLSWNEAAFEAMLHPEDSPFSSPGPLGAQFGNDPNFLKNPVFRPKNITLPKLEGPLPWRSDGKGFSPKVIEMAQFLGYD